MTTILFGQATSPQLGPGVNPIADGFTQCRHTGFGPSYGLPWTVDGFDYDAAFEQIETKVGDDEPYAWLDIEYPLPYLYEVGDQHALIDRMLGRLIHHARRIKPHVQWGFYAWPTNRGWMSKMDIDWLLGQLGAKWINKFTQWFCPNCYLQKIGSNYEPHFYAVQVAEQLSGPRPVFPAVWHRGHNGGWNNPDGFKLLDPAGWSDFCSQLYANIEQGDGGLMWWGIAAERYYMTRSVMESQSVPGQWRYPDAPWDRIRQRGVEEGWLPASAAVEPGYQIPEPVQDAYIQSVYDTYSAAIKAAVPSSPPTTGPPTTGPTTSDREEI